MNQEANSDEGVRRADSLENTQIDNEYERDESDDGNASEITATESGVALSLVTAIDDLEIANEDDAPTIIEKLERPLQDNADAIMHEITIEEAQRFADFLIGHMEQAWNDETNNLARMPDFDDNDEAVANVAEPLWLKHLTSSCDCKKWIYIEFPQVREDALSRLYVRTGEASDVHNTMVVALYAFCIQNQVINRTELGEFRRKLERSMFGLDQWTWDWLLRLIQYPYAARRLKKNSQGFVARDVLETKEKFESLVVEMKLQFPLLFEDGKLKPHIFESANPGPTFECTTCQGKFAIRYGVHCQSQERADGEHDPDDEEEGHHMCRPCFRNRISHEILLTSDHKHLRCFKEGCASYIATDVKKYLSKEVRHRLRDFQQNLAVE